MAERAQWDAKGTGIEQDSDEPASLTDEQKAMVIERVRAARAKMDARSHFGKAARWVIYVHAWTILKTSPLAPGVDFCCTFPGFAKFISEREAEREAVEEEEAHDADDVYV